MFFVDQTPVEEGSHNTRAHKLTIGRFGVIEVRLKGDCCLRVNDPAHAVDAHTRQNEIPSVVEKSRRNRAFQPIATGSELGPAIRIQIGLIRPQNDRAVPSGQVEPDAQGFTDGRNVNLHADAKGMEVLTNSATSPPESTTWTETSRTPSSPGRSPADHSASAPVSACRAR